MRTIGEYQPLNWDGDEEPCAHYVNGHVTNDEFRAAFNAFHGIDDGVPADADIKHVYVRSVRSSSSDFDYEWRHTVKGRGASPMTVWTIRSHRGEP